jgi:putative phage-type endonuclease
MRHNVEQGTTDWHSLRKNRLCASDAPAMIGDSQYVKRSDLLHRFVTGEQEEITPAKQAIFNRGHQAEASQRTIIEAEMLMDLTPCVITKTVDGMPMLASLDGLSDDGETIFEHKLWNETLVQSIRTTGIPRQYMWQLEHQLLVSEARQVLFVVSDGTHENQERIYYESDPVVRKNLIEGWKQFLEDAKNYKPKKTAIANRTKLPVLLWRVENNEVVSNIATYLDKVKVVSDKLLNKKLSTDQDYADREQLAKDVKKARGDVAETVVQVTEWFDSLSDFVSKAEEIDSLLQKLQSTAEKQVKAAKDKKKQAVVDKYQAMWEQALTAHCNTTGIDSSLIHVSPDFNIKNKRTLDTFEQAVLGEYVRAKTQLAEITEITDEQVELTISCLSSQVALIKNELSKVLSIEVVSDTYLQVK